VNRTRITYALAALLAIAAVWAVAGCGSSNDSSGGGAYGGKGGSTGETEATETAAAKSPPGAESGAAVLTVATAPKVGAILVDAKGFTVYDFHKDKGTTSSCYGGCAKVWPPVLSEGAPQSGEGASSSKLGTTKRKDGTTQVTYAGHPLYTYVADKKPGEANGHDFSSYGAQWYALKGNGEEAPD
jgi:predicted lipoprotein with Yx(FWY)xxD motif